MSPLFRLAVALALGSLAACAPPASPPPNAPVTSTGPNSNRDPQSSASLPPGFQTVHPVLPATGNVGYTQVVR